MKYNDIWGYTAPDGREYALLGVRNGTSIIDITDPANLTEITHIPGVFSIWRDLKTYQNYAYVVSHNDGGLQIIDLSNLPNSATLVATYMGILTSHNIFIDEPNGMLYAQGGFTSQPVQIFNLANPVSPVQVSFFGSRAHDVYVHNNKAFISEADLGTLAIFDVTNPANPSLISRIFFPNSGYSHNAWGTADGNYLMTTEEAGGFSVKLWDIRDLQNPGLVNEYLGPSRLAHNVVVKGTYSYIAHYADGLVILDIADPNNLTVAGSYDTNPATSGLEGAWGVYPFFDSGKVIVSDIDNGLFVFQFGAPVPNSPPVLDPISNKLMLESQSLDVQVTATDPESDPITLSVFNLPSFGLFTQTGNGVGTITFAPGYFDAGKYLNIMVVASDGALNDTTFFNLNVLNSNRPPQVARVRDQSMGGGMQLTVPLSASDPDLEPLVFSTVGLPVFATLSDNGDGSGSLYFSPARADTGTYSNIVVRVSDGALLDSVLFSLVVVAQNRAPVVNAVAAQTVMEGQILDILLTASDPDGDPVALTMLSVPLFGSFTDNHDGSGLLRLHPGFGDAGIYPSLIACATDGLLFDSTSFSLTVSETNQAPLAINDFLIIAEDNSAPVRLLENDSDPDRDEIYLTRAWPPAHGTVTVEPSGAFVNYTPANNFFGTDTFRYAITDGREGQDTALVTIQIESRNDNPEFTALPGELKVGTGDSVSLNIWEHTSDVESPDSLLNFAFTYPSSRVGLIYDSRNGKLVLFARNTTFSESSELVIRVADPDGGIAADSIQLSINSPTGTDGDSDGIRTDQFYLVGNYPNPFNPSTTIHFTIPRAEYVELLIFNQLGQQIETAVRQKLPAGDHRVRWNAGLLPSGVYYYRLVAGSFSQTKKMILLR